MTTPTTTSTSTGTTGRTGATGTTRSLEADVIRGFVIGSLLGSVIVFLLWGAVALLGGLANVNAGAIGLFTAAWGGPGFGGMLGAVLGYSKHEH